MSARAIVVRFRNSAGVDTVHAHNEIIKRTGFVWFGWWKKVHETILSPDLHIIAAANKKISVGLVNRQAEEFFVAQCDQIRVADSDPITSPDPQSTPAYYNTQAWPVWFRLTSIRKVSEAAFLSRFRLVPQNDASLYIYSLGDGGYEVKPEARGVQPDEIEAPGNSILHLSDLHFGGDHAFPTVKKKAAVYQKPLADILVERYNRSGVGIVVLSGDFITAGEQEGYNTAYEFIESALSRNSWKWWIDRHSEDWGSG